MINCRQWNNKVKPCIFGEHIIMRWFKSKCHSGHDITPSSYYIWWCHWKNMFSFYVRWQIILAWTSESIQRIPDDLTNNIRSIVRYRGQYHTTNSFEYNLKNPSSILWFNGNIKKELVADSQRLSISYQIAICIAFEIHEKKNKTKLGKSKYLVKYTLM